jgi:hypothetical protein
MATIIGLCICFGLIGIGMLVYSFDGKYKISEKIDILPDSPRTFE